MTEKKPDWRNHAHPSELAEYDMLIATDRDNAKHRRLIRNRCRMRGLAKQGENK